MQGFRELKYELIKVLRYYFEFETTKPSRNSDVRYIQLLTDYIVLFCTNKNNNK